MVFMYKIFFEYLWIIGYKRYIVRLKFCKKGFFIFVYFIVGNLFKCMRCFVKRWLFGILCNIEYNLFYIFELWKFVAINSNIIDYNVFSLDIF